MSPALVKSYALSCQIMAQVEEVGLYIRLSVILDHDCVWAPRSLTVMPHIPASPMT